ncbi:hypothetical protein KL951_003135 [Ogataea haglerorum]|nr:hypothetical protein KL951_003135 [Ogataea haglerorum]
MTPNRQYMMSPMEHVESPISKDRNLSSSPTQLSSQRLPQTVPVPKPRILAEMIPETELFQKPDGGTTITPHLSRAKRSREAEMVTAMRKIENDQDYFYTKLKQIMEPPSRQESPLPELSQLMDSQGNYLLERIYRSLDLYGTPSNYTDDVTIVKHFFTRLLPSVSSSYNPLWPGAAIQYCDKTIVRSCFVSLGALHLAGWVNDTGTKHCPMLVIGHTDKTSKHRETAQGTPIYHRPHWMGVRRCVLISGQNVAIGSTHDMASYADCLRTQRIHNLSERN